MARTVVCLFILVTVAACQTTRSFDAGKRVTQNLVILAEDGDRDSIHGNNQINRRVLNVLSTQISEYGFNVFDETAISFNRAPKTTNRRSNEELLESARSFDRPLIDTIVFFTVFTESRKKAHTNEIGVRIIARLVNTRSGQILGTFELTEESNLDPNCIGDCYAERVGDMAVILGREVADILGQKLSLRFSHEPIYRGDESSIRGITMTFEEFNVFETEDIKSYLKIFSGYKSYQLLSSFHRHMELWYETSISHSKLKQNLNRMFTELEIKARITYSGNSYKIRRIIPPSSALRRAPNYRW